MDFDIQKPKLDYLKYLTLEKWGIVQHTTEGKHELKFGFATDDNARALHVALFLKKDFKFMTEFEQIYLKNILYAQGENGSFYCYISEYGEKLQNGDGDWLGRACEALAISLSFLDENKKTEISKKILQSFNLVYDHKLSLRNMCFLITASYYLLQANLSKKDTDLIKKCLEKWKAILLSKFKANSNKLWIWPEEVMTYDNGKVIQAYLLLGIILKDENLVKIAKDMLDFYLSKTWKKNYFQAVGNKGWWTKDKKPEFDEQPLEVYSLICALVSFYLYFKDEKYFLKAKQTYQWYWGLNRLSMNLVDKDGGVFDGLLENGFNKNKGAESYLSLILSYIVLTQKVQF